MYRALTSSQAGNVDLRLFERRPPIAAERPGWCWMTPRHAPAAVRTPGGGLVTPKRADDGGGLLGGAEAADRQDRRQPPLRACQPPPSDRDTDKATPAPGGERALEAETRYGREVDVARSGLTTFALAGAGRRGSGARLAVDRARRRGAGGPCAAHGRSRRLTTPPWQNTATRLPGVFGDDRFQPSRPPTGVGTRRCRPRARPGRKPAQAA